MDYCYGTSHEGYMLCIVRSFVFRRRLWSCEGLPSIVFTLRRVVSPVLKPYYVWEGGITCFPPSIVHTRGEVIPLALKKVDKRLIPGQTP